MPEIKCGRKDCSAWSDCKFWNNAMCPFFVVDDEQPKKEKKKKSSGIRPTEDGEQIAVIEYCRLSNIQAVHIPNEGKRSYFYGAKMRAMGLQKGFPDIFIPTAKKGFYGLFIELKRDDKAYPSKEQIEWLRYLNGQGYKALIAYGAKHAISEIEKYMK